MRPHFNYLIYIFTSISLLVSSLVAMPAMGEQIKPNKIVVFGDSLSAAYGMPQDKGWVTLLQQRLSKAKLNYEVINASISGETTSGGLSRFSGMLKTQKPSVVIIELGGNDGLRGLSAVETSNNLAAMILKAQKTKAKVLLLGMKIPPNYGLKYSKQFSENYQTLATKFNIKLVPFFLHGIAGNQALFQSDGLHPTAMAQGKLLSNVWPILTKMLNNN